MSLSQPRTIYGVHSMTPFSRTTGVPYGMARLLSNSTFKLTGALVELYSGSNRFSWQVEDGDIKAELGFSLDEYPNWIFELFGGKAPTDGSAETTGAITAVTNKVGTSIVAATGILSVVTILSSGANLKFGRYVLKATSSAALSLYAMSDVDFGHGTAGVYTDDTLKIATLSVATGAASDVTSFGLEFTGGASATSFVTGDTATFEVRPPNTVTSDVVIGGISDVYPEFSALLYTKKLGSGAMFEFEVYKLKNIGLSVGAQRNQYGKNDYTALASYDSVQNGVYRARMLKP